MNEEKNCYFLELRRFQSIPKRSQNSQWVAARFVSANVDLNQMVFGEMEAGKQHKLRKRGNGNLISFKMHS